MPTAALVLSVLYLVLLFGVQSLVQLRETGTSGWMPRLGQTRTELAANLLFLVSLVLDLAGPVLVLAGIIQPISAINLPVLHALGLVLFGVALFTGITARHTMGAAWRTGIDPSSPTRLVTHGLFAVARNPSYTSMIGVSLAIGFLVPTIVASLAVALRIIGLEVQTRLVEEPFLLQAHGRSYRQYAERVGRFLPLLGRWPR